MRIGRVLAVTATLAILGGLAGAIGGCVVIAIAMIFEGSPGPYITMLDLLAVASAAGGVCGLLVAPLLSWTMLRNVPIWRSATETALAAGAAATGALILTGGNPASSLVATAIAALLAAARLRWTFRRKPHVEPEVAV